MLRAAAVLGTLALLLPATLGVAVHAEPATLRDRLRLDLAAAGLDEADLPDPVAWRVVDLSSGGVTVEAEPRAAFLARLAELPLARGHAPEGPAHRVVGDVAHTCYDGIRPDCYKFYTNALGPSQPLRVRDLEDEHGAAKDLYDSTPARGVLAFPLHNATALYVQGAYASGTHRAASPLLFLTPGSAAAGVSVEDGLPGSGTSHPDRAVLGTGVGRVFLVNLNWAMGLYISIGVLRAHGAWTFCDAEAHPDCASP